MIDNDVAPAPPPTTSADRTWVATWVAGPAAGASVRLGAGTHVVGRSSHATVHCADQRIEPFHLQFEVGADGRLRVVQIAGRLPVVIDGELRDDDAVLEPSRQYSIDIGASRLVVRTASGRHLVTAHLGPTVAGRSAVVRAGRVVPAWAPCPVAVPATDLPPNAFTGSLLPALLGLAGAAVVAAVVHQPLFLLFGALGAVVAVSTWAAQRLGVVRHRRRSRRAERDAVDAFRVGLAQQRDARMRHHRASVGTLHRAVATAAEPDSSLWARRRDHHDAFTVSLGIGDVSWQPVLSGDGAAVPPVCWGIVEQASTIPDATVPVDLAGGMSLAVCGPHAEPVAAALLAQLAVQAGPADWRLMIVTESRGAWAHWTSLPHSAGGAPTAGVLDEQDVADLLRDGRPDDERKLVVVVDEVRLLAARTSPVRRLLATAPTSTLIAVVADPATVPSLCTSLLVTSIDGRATWTCDTATGDLPRPLRLAGLARGDAASLVASLARFVDPEDPTAAADTLPTDVALASLLAHVDPDAIAASWAAAAPDTSPETVIGTAPDGVVTVDLVRDGPHALVAGTTGSGKSELLRSLVVGLAATLSPDHVTFVLFDYKGGAAFDACAPLPHVVGVVTDLDGRMTERALRSLRAELTRREHLLRDCGVADLTALRAEAGRPVVPRLVVVVDEFAAMAVEHADLLHALIGIAQRGRSLGVHLVLATQRPAGVVSDDIRANTNLRIALRLTDPTDSLDVVGDPAAAALSRQHRGRALMRLGPDELIMFQSAYRTAEVVPAIVAAAQLTGPAPTRSAWCEPLPCELNADAVPDGALGLVDLPDLQVQQPWVWDPRDGHVVVAGARGSGVTTTLLKAATARLDASVELAVIDARGDVRWSHVAAHPRCAGVVALHERERLIRLIAMQTTPVGGSLRRVLVIDGIAAVRLELEALELSDTRVAFERLLSDASLGLTLLIGTDAPAAVPAAVVSRSAHRWVHHLPDRHDAASLGVAAAHVPPTLQPGRVAVTSGRDTVEAQVARVDASRLVGQRDLPRVRRVDVLPELVAAAECGGAISRDGALSLPLGRRFDDLDPVSLDISDGEHVLVIGPGRSGRSSVLVRLLRAWSDAIPAGWIGVVAPRRSPLRDLPFPGGHGLLDHVPPAGPALVVVDDAELVDDGSGALTRLVASRRPGLLVVAAGRPEALRTAYGHWTTTVRRSRLGIVMTGARDLDADLLGTTLPRWSPIPPRRGLAYMVCDGTETLVQCALDDAPPVRARPDGRQRDATRSLVAVS